MLFWFSLYAYTPFVNPELINMGVTASVMGFIGGAYGFTQMLLRIPVGIGSDRWQKKFFICMGCLSAVLAALTMLVFHNPAGFLIGRALGGVAASSWVPFTVMYASYYKAEHTTRAITMINLASQLGRFISFLLAAWLTTHFGARAAFVLALCVGIAGLVMSLFIKETSGDNSKKPASVKALLAIGKDKNVLLCSVLAILVQIIAFATKTTFTLNHAVSIGATQAQLSFTQLALLSSGIILSFLLGRFILKHFEAKHLVVLGFIITIVYCIIVPITGTMPQLYLVQMLGGIGNTLTFSLLMGLCVQNVDNSKRGAAMGFFQSIYGLGMTIGPVMMGLIIDFSSMRYGFFTMAFIAAIAAVLSMRYLKRKAA